MKLRHLEELLQGVEEFHKPKVQLEQYITPSHLGSHMLYTIQSQYGDFAGKVVADLGAGCGALSIGAAALDAALVVGFEVDADALAILATNLEEQEITNCDVVHCDVVRDIPDSFNRKFDTVIMNPPFGTKNNAGIDMKFLERALKLTTNVVYSLHKTSTRNHVLKVAKAAGADGEVLAELRYDLPSTYRFHKKTSVDIQVDFIKFTLKHDEVL